MTVAELKAEIDKWVASGKVSPGDKVYFDTEARVFHFHLIEVDGASPYTKDVSPNGDSFLVLTTRYHLSEGVEDA